MGVYRRRFIVVGSLTQRAGLQNWMLELMDSIAWMAL
jgi:hypothetical protein